MRLSPPLTMTLLLALAVSAGCRLSTGNEVVRERQLGLIRFHEDPLVLQVPGTVAVGSTFDVTVGTYASGCIEQGDTEVSVLGRVASVRPYDVFVTAMPPYYACTRELILYTHRASLRFDEVGPATVTIYGRVQPGDSVVAVSRSVQVQ